MIDRRSELLLDGGVARAFAVSCRAPRSGFADTEWSGAPQIVLPQRGVFVVERGGGPVVVDVTTAFVFGRDEEYRVRHPVSGGDDCTVLLLPRELHEEALGSERGAHGCVRASTQLAARALTEALRREPEALAAEEATLLVVHALAQDLIAAAPRAASVRDSHRRRAEDVRSLLASRPAAHWRLGDVARAVHCSPYHLARLFRVVTGETIGRYLLRVRLGLALERLAAGERDLARLATDVGFAHHSHFSARFRAVFGTTPSAARATLTSGRIRDLSRIVTAANEPRP